MHSNRAIINKTMVSEKCFRNKLYLKNADMENAEKHVKCNPSTIISIELKSIVREGLILNKCLIIY
jgi:hypothetical protein